MVGCLPPVAWWLVFASGTGFESHWRRPVSQTTSFLVFSGLKFSKRGRREDFSNHQSHAYRNCLTTAGLPAGATPRQVPERKKTTAALPQWTGWSCALQLSSRRRRDLQTSPNDFLFQWPSSYFSLDLTKFDLTTGCMAYLPACTIEISQMQANIPYMDPMGK